MHLVLIIVVVVFVIAVVLAAVAAVVVTFKAFRSLRTGYRSVHSQVSERATSTLTTLQARTLPAGPRQEAAELRHDLRRSREATRRLLSAAYAPPGHFSDWAQQLAQATDTLDRYLAALQREPNAAHLTAGLSAFRPLVQDVTAAGAELRSVIRQSGRAVAATDWSALTGGIRDEIDAASAGIAYLHSQTVPPLSSPSYSPSSITAGRQRPGAPSRYRRHGAFRTHQD